MTSEKIAIGKRRIKLFLMLPSGGTLKKTARAAPFGVMPVTIKGHKNSNMEGYIGWYSQVPADQGHTPIVTKEEKLGVQGV